VYQEKKIDSGSFLEGESTALMRIRPIHTRGLVAPDRDDLPATLHALPPLPPVQVHTWANAFRYAKSEKTALATIYTDVVLIEELDFSYEVAKCRPRLLALPAGTRFDACSYNQRSGWFCFTREDDEGSYYAPKCKCCNSIPRVVRA